MRNTSTLCGPFVLHWIWSCFHDDGRPHLFSRKRANIQGSALAWYLLAENACYHKGKTIRLRKIATDAVVAFKFVEIHIFVLVESVCFIIGYSSTWVQVLRKIVLFCTRASWCG